MNDTQSVVDDANSDAMRSDAAGDAQDDLESLLGQFDQVDTPDTTGEQVDENRMNQVLDYVKRKEAQEIEETVETDINSAVQSISDGLNVDVPAMAVKGVLYEKVSTDPRAMKIWESRKTNPSAWNQFVSGVKNEISQEFSKKPDANLTSDRDAVMSAVHNASTASPDAEEVDVTNMSDYQFEQHKAKLKTAARKAKV